MPHLGAGPAFDVLVDEGLLAEDLAHASDAASAAIEAAVLSMRRNGVGSSISNVATLKDATEHISRVA